MAERQGGGELAFPVLPRHAQNGRANWRKAGLMFAVDRLNELALPRTQMELRAHLPAGSDLEILEEGNHSSSAGETRRIPGVRARGCRFERLTPAHQGFSTWPSEAHIPRPIGGAEAYHISRCPGSNPAKAAIKRGVLSPIQPFPAPTCLFVGRRSVTH